MNDVAEAPTETTAEKSLQPQDDAPQGEGGELLAEIEQFEPQDRGPGKKVAGSIFDGGAVVGESREPEVVDGEPVDATETPADEAADEPEQAEATDEAADEPDDVEEGAPSDEADEAPADDAPWETRAKYHQSRADRLQNQLDTLKTQAQSVEEVAPLLDVMQKDPAILDYIEAKYGRGEAHATLGQPSTNGSGHPTDTPTLTPGGRGERTASSDSPGAPPEKPVRPEKPAEFNEFDAQSDPESTSYQYRQALEDYRTAAAEYPVQLIEWQQAQQQAKADAERQKQQQAQARQAYVQQVQETVVQDFGGQPEEAQAFVRWASGIKDDADYLKTLWTAFKVREGGRKGGKRKPPPRQKAVPPAAAAAPSATNPATPTAPKVIKGSIFD